MEKCKVYNASDNALPAYESAMAAGLDVRANLSEPMILNPGERKLVPTGLYLELPENCEAQIRPRSGLAFKHGITVLNSPGTIDPDYRGEVKVLLINLSNEAFEIQNGERIAQMVISRFQQIEWQPVSSVEELSDTERGAGGFGHSGKNKAMQRRLLLTIGMLLFSVLLFAQPAKKTRNIAKMDDASVAARKISVRYTEGIKAYHTGNYDEALRVFNGIILDNPKHDPSYFMLSMVHTSQNNPQEAIHDLQQALKIDKSNVWYKVDLADLYMQTENYAAAAKLWEQICKEKDNNEYYLYSLSQAYVNLNKLDKVIDTYNRMEALMGHNDEITRAKVSVWLYQNKVKEAVGEYEKLIKIYPHNADFYVKAGDIYQSNDMLAQAMTYYEKAAAMNSNDPNLNMTLASYYSKKVMKISRIII